MGGGRSQGVTWSQSHGRDGRWGSAQLAHTGVYDTVDFSFFTSYFLLFTSDFCAVFTLTVSSVTAAFSETSQKMQKWVKGGREGVT